jgi:hypothetical protein
VQNGGDFFGFGIIFQYENDGGLSPRLMDHWRLGPPWTTRRGGMLVGAWSWIGLELGSSPARVWCGKGRTVKPARCSPGLVRRRGGQAAMTNRWR